MAGHDIAVGVNRQDALARETTFALDGANRRVEATLPDTEQKIRYAFNAMDQLVSVAGQNANQTVAHINTLGAGNVLPNPGAEQADPYSPSRARYWTNSTGSSNRSNSQAHSGDYSLPLSLTTAEQYWSESNLDVTAGGRYLARYWVKKSADSVSASFWITARVRDLDGAVQDLNGPVDSLDGSSASWQQSDPFRLDVPGDSQAVSEKPPLAEFRAYGQGAANTSAWFDDFSLYRLSTDMELDAQGQVQSVYSPDGAVSRVERDRYGRIVQWVNPLSQRSRATYDALDRVLTLTDPHGITLAFEWDPVGNLSKFTDGRGQVTLFGYDVNERLESITYEDASTELFTYDAASNLETYTDNMGQTRTYGYDDAERLTSVTFASDSSQLLYAYDAASNLTSTTERDGDTISYLYDAINRKVFEERSLAGGSTNPTWAIHSELDAVGNRTGFFSNPSRFGTAIFGTDRFYGSPTWSVPSPGFDEMNRMPAYLDSQSNQSYFQYDLENRLTQITYPFGTPALETSLSYNLVGQLLQLRTMGSSQLLKLDYAYDLAGNRVFHSVDNDTFDYGLDSAGRLVTECLNCFVDRLPDQFQEGELSSTLLDPFTPRVSLAAFSDSFSGDLLYADRWRTAYAAGRYTGMEIRQKDGLMFAFPRGYSNLVQTPPVHNDFGLSSSDLWCGLEHRQKLVGDFDLQVDFADFQGEHTLGVNYMQTGLLVSDMPFEESTRPSNLSTNCFLSRSRLPAVGGDNQCYQVNILKTGGVAFNSSVASTDLSGKLRIVRSGNTVTAYRDVSGSWSLMGTYSSFGSADLYAGLLFTLKESLGSVRFTNFQRVTPSDPFPTLGTFVSRIYNAGRSVTWGDISWNESLPGGTDLEFQVAVASSPAGPWNFVGPDGTAGTRFSTAGGEALPSLTDQYIRYIAYLTGGGSATPEFNQVSITYGGNLPWSLRVFDIDDAGNLTAVTTTDAAGVSSDVRDNPAWPAPERLNDLNQILRQDLTPAGGSTTSWAYTWDANGNLLTRDDGSNTWTYSWNDENRLTRVQGPGGVDVSYVYDGSGRMLQRIAADTTLFRWDGWDCYQEETNGDTTTYFLPDGQLRSFERGGDIYQCHSDALGSVRMVTDNTGAVAARFDYGA